jgi:hypothetical protein
MRTLSPDASDVETGYGATFGAAIQGQGSTRWSVGASPEGRAVAELGSAHSEYRPPSPWPINAQLRRRNPFDQWNALDIPNGRTKRRSQLEVGRAIPVDHGALRPSVQPHWSSRVDDRLCLGWGGLGCKNIRPAFRGHIRPESRPRHSKASQRAGESVDVVQHGDAGYTCRSLAPCLLKV